jgi:hypothetical protein
VWAAWKDTQGEPILPVGIDPVLSTELDGKRSRYQALPRTDTELGG